MKKVEVYDPALCCSTGVCGPSPDAALSEFASALKQLECVEVTRYNLSQEPGAFVENPLIQGILQKEGPDALPVILIDGELVMKGVYPTAVQLEKLLAADPNCCSEIDNCCSADDDDCCGDDADCCSEEDDTKQDSACCGDSGCC